MEYFECVPDIVTSTTTAAAAVWFEIMYLLRFRHLIVILRVSYLVIVSAIITTATAAVLVYNQQINFYSRVLLKVRKSTEICLFWLLLLLLLGGCRN